MRTPLVSCGKTAPRLTWRRAVARCLLPVALILSCGPVRAELPADLGARLAEGYARPAAGALQRSAATLLAAMQDWCAGKGDGRRVRDAFGETTRAWAGVEFLRFGPLVQGNRYERMAFWPDTRGMVARQTQAALAARDEALLAPGALAGRSVAQQGLPALEFLLYREGGLLARGGADDYGCRYAQAVAANVSALASELAQAWSAQGEFGQRFVAPAADNPLYRDAREVAAEALKALSTGLQFARDAKLLPVLGASAAEARPQRAAFWRSDETLPTLSAGLAGMSALSQLLAPALPADARWAGDAVRDELARAQAALAGVDQPIAQAVAQAEARGRLALAAMILKNAKSIVDQDVAGAMGVSIGFNALDGD